MRRLVAELMFPKATEQLALANPIWLGGLERARRRLTRQTASAIARGLYTA